MNVRAFPKPAYKAPADWPGPWCQWCNQPIATGRRDRTWHRGRDGEPDCLAVYFLHTDPAKQYAHVAARDTERCWDCKRSAWKWTRGPVLDFPGLTAGPYCYTEPMKDLELEHTVPLWSVSHLSDEERRPYYGPDNLRLRCTACHKAKTRAEAGARAKGKRQGQMRLDVPRKPATMRSGGKLQGGGKLPGKGQGRRLQSRNTLRRR